MLLVAPLANHQMTPRGQRASNLAGALEREWDVEIVALPAATSIRNAVPTSRKGAWRRLASRAGKSVLLDKWEPWAARRIGRRPRADGAVLVAAPWSPATYAARYLKKAGVPYVVDTGDPWALTHTGEMPTNVSAWRARRAERRIWEGAAGAVVTTEQQGARLHDLFPVLPILVRPNGYVGDPPAADTSRAARGGSRSLRLAHFGTLYDIRVDIGFLLGALADSGDWDSITFVQYGDDAAGMLDRVPAGVRVERHPARPWAELIEISDEFDACVVVGNLFKGLLPSKAIQSLTMPVPRIAVTATTTDDALTDYARGQSGWLVVTPTEEKVAERVLEHVQRSWMATELAPPPEESWQVVGETVARFVDRCLLGESSGLAPSPGSPVALPGDAR
jgi:glycosyltransferase involved in cell wall biosynthesis